MGFSFTEEQQKAIDTLNINCIVPAGAGSGKTRVLVERYIKIIEENLENNSLILENIVAITFTDKAANEMKGKIRKEINKRRNEEINNGNINLAILWKDILFRLERASISTIHSFCARVLREYPVEADIDPEFKVIDAQEADWLLTGIIEKILKKYLEEEKKKGISFIYKWVFVAGFDKAVSNLKQLYNQIYNSGFNLSEVELLTNDSFEEQALKLLPDIYDIIKICDDLYYSDGKSKKLIKFQSTWPNLKDIIISSNSIDEGFLLAITSLEEITKGNFGSSAKEQRKKANDYLKNLVELLESIDYLEFEKLYLKDFYPLLYKIEENYLKEKENLNGIDFDELQIRTLNLLKENEQVRMKLREKIRYLMIDEFQDNNQVQKNLVSLLLSDENNQIKPGSLFVVGDPKQSIYRFRGADVKVFKEIEMEIRQENGRIAPLTNNFRSNPEIIDFVNYFFPYIMSSNPESPNYYENTIAKNQENYIKDGIEFLPIYDEDDLSQREAEAQAIAMRIDDLLQEGKEPKEVAIIFRSLKNVKIYEEALKSYNIPYYIIGGRGFYEKQEILDLINVLYYLADPSNKIALAGILRSPMVAIKDETLYYILKNNFFDLESKDCKTILNHLDDIEKNKIEHFIYWMNQLKKQLGRQKISNILDNLLELTQYKAIILALPNGTQGVANIEKFIRLLENNTSDNPYSIYDYVRRIKRLIDEEQQEKEAPIESESGNTVKIMTIHQSKGLEFPYVIIPDLSRKPVYDDNLIKFNSDIGLICKIPFEDDWAESLRFKYDSKISKQLDKEESVRLFYVAATRAEKKLILSGKIEDTKEKFSIDDVLSVDTWSKWFDIILNYQKISIEKKEWLYNEIVGNNKAIRIKSYDISYKPSEGKIKLSFLDDSNIKNEKEDIINDYTKPITINPKDKIYTISEIKQYLTCQRSYFYSVQLNLSNFTNRLSKDNKHSKEVTQYNDIPPTVRGSIVHELLEQLVFYPEKRLTWKEDIQKSALLKGYNVEIFTTEEWGNFEQEVAFYVENYLKSGLSKGKTENLSIKTEYDFILTLNNGIIRGVIDRLEISEQGEFSIIDYKTDKDIIENQYKSQVLTYALAIMKRFGLNPIEGIIFYLRHNKIEKYILSKENLLLWEKTLEDILFKINKSNNILDYKQNLNECSRCPFEVLCLKKD